MRIILLILSLVTAQNLRAATRKTEFYFHPDIHAIDPQPLKRKDLSWEKNKIGIMRFLPTLYFYPKNYRFGLAPRDFEIGEDLAKLFIKDEQMQKRIFSLNVSRNTSVRPELWNYLRDQGVVADDPERMFLLVDSGMLGNIPNRIKATAPESLRGKIQAHFLLSAHPSYPSSRVFLASMNPQTIFENVRLSEATILTLENVPHATYGALSYAINPKSGKWEALTGPSYRISSTAMSAGDPLGFGGQPLQERDSADPKQALAYMSDLKHFAMQPENQHEFDHWVKLWTKLGKAYQNSVRAKDPKILKEALEAMLPEKSAPKLLEVAVVMDALDIIAKNAPHGKIRGWGRAQESLKKRLAKIQVQHGCQGLRLKIYGK